MPIRTTRIRIPVHLVFRKSIDEASAVTELLLKLASLKEFDLTAYILSVNEDAMGVFSFDPTEGRNGYRRA